MRFGSSLLPPWRPSIEISFNRAGADTSPLTPSDSIPKPTVLKGKRLREVCGRATMAEAVAEAVALATGVRVHTMRLADAAPYRDVVSYDTGNDQYAANWIRAGAADAWEYQSVSFQHRASMLGQALTNFDAEPSIENTLRAQRTTDLEITWELSAALPLWWNARLNEGHTPASAQMMLGLLVPTRTLSQIIFSPDGTPPTLRSTVHTRTAGPAQT